MAPLSDKNKRILFYSGWAILSLVQAMLTQVQDDEAYYWVYSRFLNWGYFDHPPMIALLIRTGTFLLPGNLGLRLLPVILNILTIRITEKLTNSEKPGLFYAVCLSVAAFQIAGFWAVPDTPLLFFTALFFLVYRNFLRKPSWQHTILLAITSGLLLYSKYHGLLVILFTFISNGRNLLRQPKIYAAGVIIVILLLPHLWWQYKHDWITFRFQLLENKAHPYQLLFTTNYIIGQIAIAGPLTGIILLYSTFARRPADLFEKALKYTAIGIFAFFLLSSLKGDVEPNWTAPALIPLCVLAHRYLLAHVGWRRWLLRLLYPTCMLVLLFRIVMIFDIVPLPAVVERFHSWQGWPQKLKAKTHGLPVVFTNSYQRASMFWYQTGQTTFSLNTYKERQNNYDYWPIEDSLLGKRVMFMDIYQLSRFPDSLHARLWTIGFKEDSSYVSFTRVSIRPDKYYYRTAPGQILSLHFKALIPAGHKKFLTNNPTINEPVKIGIFNKYEWIKDIPCSITLRDLLLTPQQTIAVAPALPPGSYYFEFAIGSVMHTFTQNSNRILVEVTY